MIHVVVFIFSFCSFCAVLVLAQVLGLFFHDEIFWFSLTTGAYLCIYAVRYVKGLRKASQEQGGDAVLPGIFLSIFISAASSVLHMLYFMNLYLEDRFGFVSARLFFFCGLLGIFYVIGRLSATLLARLTFWNRGSGNSNERLRNVLKPQFLGYFTAGVSAALVPLLNTELFMVGFWLGLFALSAVWLLILLLGNKAVNQKRHIVVASALLAFLIIVMIRHPLLGQYFLKKTYFAEPVRQISDIFRVKKSWPDVVRYPLHSGYMDLVPFSPHPLDIWLLTSYSRKYLEDPAYPWGYFFLLNHQLFMNSQWDEFYQEYCVHIPVSIQGSVPKRVLVLGARGPFILKELVKYSAIESILLTGIDRSMLVLAEGEPMLSYGMAGVLKDSRIRVEPQEAFSFLKANRDKFDAVYIQSPDIVGFATGQYYTREFFSLIAEHLNPGGYAVIDSSASFPPEKNGALSRISWPVLSNTLFAAGFKTIVPYVIDLEPDNPKAFEALGAVLFGRQFLADPACDPTATSCLPDENKLQQVQRIVESFSTSIKQGFVFMSKAELSSDVRFLQNDVAVPLRVLNERRFQRALGKRRTLSEDARKFSLPVHSLLFPRLLRLQ